METQTTQAPHSSQETDAPTLTLFPYLMISSNRQSLEKGVFVRKMGYCVRGREGFEKAAKLLWWKKKRVYAINTNFSNGQPEALIAPLNANSDLWVDILILILTHDDVTA